VKKFLKILLYSLVGVVLLSLLTVAFSQTPLFRHWLRSFLLSTADNELNGHLSLGAFHGNIFTGLTIDSVSLVIDGVTFLRADNVELRYNPLKLIDRKISAGTVVISRPTIQILRGRDSVWNIDRLAKQKSTPSGPFRYTIEVKNLDIVDATFILYDSTASQTTDSVIDHQIDYSHITLEHVGIKLSAVASATMLDARIQEIRCTFPRNGILVKKIAGDFFVDTTRAEVKNLNIITQKTSIECNASLQKINILRLTTLETLENTPVKVQCKASRVDFAELKKFLPSLSFLEGTGSVATSLSGQFADISIDAIDVSFGTSHISGQGRLRNLHHPASLTIDARFDDCLIDPSEVVDLLPPFEIPDYGHLGPIKFIVEYHGEPLNFQSSVQCTTLDAGSTAAELTMDLRVTPVTYTASVKTVNTNLGRIFGIPSLEGQLSMTSTISGSGFRLEELTTTATADIDSSILSRLPINRTHFSINTKPNTIESSISGSLGSARITAIATLIAAEGGFNAYTLDAECVHLNTAELLNNERYESSFNFITHARGSGTSFDDATGRIDLLLMPSSIREKFVEARTITFELDQRDPRDKTITLNSTIADAAMHGQFAISKIGNIIVEQFQRVTDAVAEKSFLADSALGVQTLLTGRPSPHRRIHHRPPSVLRQDEMVNMNYEVRLKDLSPIALFFHTTSAAHGTFKGFLTGTSSDMLMGGDYQAENVVYSDSSHQYLLNKGIVSFEIDHITPTNTTDSIKIRLQMSASDLYLGSTRFTNAQANLHYWKQAGTFSLQGTIDSILTVDVGGTIAVAAAPYVLTVDNLLAQYKGYDWELPSAVSIPFDTTSLTIPLVKFVHEDESVTLQGSLHANGKIDASLTIDRLNLLNLKYFYTNVTQTDIRNFTGRVTADATITGTLENPTISAHARTADLAYGDVTLGTFQGALEHSQGITTVDASFQRAKESEGAPKTDFSIQGTIPLNLALTSIADRYSTGEFDLNITSKDFRLDLLDPFISTFDRLAGKLNCNLHIGGTAAMPSYSGSITVDSVQALFIPNNMKYWVYGKFEPRADSIIISSLTINNDFSDRPDGLVSVIGSVHLRGLTVDSFDLTAFGALQILSENSRQAMSSVYGTLYAQIGDNGLHLTGKPDNSILSGDIELRKAILTFPPIREQLSYGASENLVGIIFTDDTLLAPPLDLTDSIYYAALQKQGNGSIERARALELQSALLQGMDYDLHIRTAGQVSITMMFTPLEELSANLSGEITVQKSEGIPKFVGEIEVGNQSRYRFIKDFIASGKLIFTGPFDNPALNLEASFAGERKSMDTTVAGKWVVVTLKITGTRRSPAVQFELTQNGEQVPGDVQNNAIVFILTNGQFAEDLTPQEHMKGVGGINPLSYNSLLSGLSSSVLAGPITEFLRNNFSSVIQSAEVSFGSESFAQPEVRLIGSVGASVWRYSGRINDFGNGNVSVEVPVGRIVHVNSIVNLVLEYERRLETQNASISTKRELTNNLRLFYRFTF
jgi:hypothetical protein